MPRADALGMPGRKLNTPPKLRSSPQTLANLQRRNSWLSSSPEDRRLPPSDTCVKQLADHPSTMAAIAEARRLSDESMSLSPSPMRPSRVRRNSSFMSEADSTLTFQPRRRSSSFMSDDFVTGFRERSNSFKEELKSFTGRKRHSLSKGVSIFTRSRRRRHKQNAASLQSESDDDERQVLQKFRADFGDPIVSVAISLDNSTFGVCGASGITRVYSTADGSVVAEFVQKSGINALMLLCGHQHGEPMLALGTFAGLVEFHDVATKEELGKLTHASGTRTIVKMASPSDGLLAVLSLECAAVYCVRHTPFCASELTRLVPDGEVLPTQPGALAISADGQTVATGAGKLIEVWHIGLDDLMTDVDRIASAATVDINGPRVRRHSFTKKGRRPSNRGDSMLPERYSAPGVARRDFFQMAEVRQYSSNSIHSVALSTSGELLAVGTIFHVEIYAVVRTRTWRPSSHATGADLAAKRKRFEAEVASAGTRRVWTSPFYACEPRMLLAEVHSQQGEVAISSEGLVAVAGGFSTTVIDALSGSTIHTAQLQGRARTTYISQDGSLVLTGSLDGQVSLTAIHHGAESCRYGISVEDGGAAPTVRALDMSLDSSLLLLGGDAGGKGVVSLYRTRDNALVRCIPRHLPLSPATSHRLIAPLHPPHHPRPSHAVSTHVPWLLFIS